MGKWTRRAFITTGVLAGGGLIVGVAVRPGHRTPELAKFMQNDGEILVNAWVKLLPDNRISVIVPHAEMGQGAHTALPMMLAEEMDADWETVSMEEAPAHEEYATFDLARDFILPSKVPGIIDDTIKGAFLEISQKMSLQITGGSYSVRATGARSMRIAGAAARELLIKSAATQWQVAEADIRTAKSHLYHDASGQSAPYSEFAADAAALKGSPQPILKTPDQFSIVGKQEIQRFDIPAKVDGTASFGIDIDLPGMRYASIKTAPVFGSKVLDIDSSEVDKLTGVLKIVNLGSAVGVIADSYWQAKKAVDKLKVTFSTTESDNTDSASIFAQFRQDMDNAINDGSEKKDFASGDARAKLKSADKIIEAEYQVPYLAHATMEPMNCTALFSSNAIELWTGTQNPLGVRNAIADEFDVPRENVTVHNQYLGGGFGRRAGKDYATQAATLAKALPGTPVKMIWSREEDTRHDNYRPAIISRFKGALDAQNKPIAWENQFIDKHEPTEAPDIPYAINDKFIHYTDSPTHVPFGPWRSVDHSQHAFFTESFIDELAAAANVDGFRFRRNLLQQEPRYLKVLETAAKMANWGEALPENWGQGIALHASFNSIVAQVVNVDMSRGQPKVAAVFCAADPGLAVSPDGFKAQMESGIIFGLTAALYGEVTIKNGAVEQSNFHDYPMIRMNTAPDISVEIINSGNALGGGGEPGTPPIAPALTNAIFAATGKRIRQLPVKL